MLTGEYQHNIDKKGRIFIPAKLREDLGSKIIVSKSLDRTACLFIYSEQEWNTLVEKITSQKYSGSRNLQRYFFSGAVELEYDAQGRVLLPQQLRSFAQLEDASSTTIVGVSNHIEIWSTDNWAAENEEFSQEEILKALDGCDF